MDSLSTISILAGPIVLAGYLIGSATTTWLQRAAADRRASDHAVEAFVALACSTVAWLVIDEVSPGNVISRVGLFSNQVLTAWQSVAAWTGLAVVAGCSAPVFRRFRGSFGLAPAAALLAVHFPWLLFGCAAAGGSALAFGRRPNEVHVIAVGALLPLAWLAWVFDWIPAWGLANGPESTIWAMVLSLVLGIRWWSEYAPAERLD